MAFDGTWKLTSQTPVGEQTMTATVTTDGETVNGSVETTQGTFDISDGTLKGNDVSWTLQKAVMGMDMKFAGTIDGDNITGTVSPGSFGNFPATGSRA